MDDLTTLATAAAAGDRLAIERFVRASQADVWRLCSHLGSPALAADLTQDTYERALKALPSFRGESSARTWLLSIARRACADHVRSATRRRRLQARVEQERPAQHVEAAIGRVDVEHLVAGLPSEFRDAFVLTQVLGLPYADAAEVCGCPIGTIRSRVARAREALVGGLGAAAADS